MFRRWREGDPTAMPDYVHDAMGVMAAKGDMDAALALVGTRRGPYTGVTVAAALVRKGDVRGARFALRGVRGWVNPGVAAAVWWASGQERHARHLLARARQEEVDVLGAMTLAAVLHRHGADVGAVVREAFGDVLTDHVLVGLASGLHFEGAFAEAAAFAERGTGRVAAFDAAGCWARAGDLDRALRWVATAIDRGWDDPAALDADDALAPLRAHPGWPAVRARLGPPSPPH
ncbi:MAG TPA: hypothetical protein VF519_16805 [Mycobacteriales bacterium]|jgi:hypothetical protein